MSQEHRELGQRIGALVQAGQMAEAYALLAPVLAQRTPFLKLGLIGEAIGAGPLAVNKRIAERLFLKAYDLELERAQSHRIWAYRKAGWAVDELQESIAQIYDNRGEPGLRELPGIGKSLAGTIAGWLTGNDGG